MTRQLYDDDPYLTSCDTIVSDYKDGFIQFDETVFYPLGGGQVGDTGTALISGKRYEITNTIRSEDGHILHDINAGCADELIGHQAELTIDWGRRYAVMQFHTALHVLLTLLEYPVTGAKVGPQKGHLDFDLGGDLIDKEDLTSRLNQIISQNHPVGTLQISDYEVAEKSQYSKIMTSKGNIPPVRNGIVRFVQIGTAPQFIDLQPCGGTHVRNTSEIGTLRISKIKSMGRRNRRVTIGFD